MDQVSQSCDNYYLTISTKILNLYTNQHLEKKVQVGKDQEKAQSEKDSHSKNQKLYNEPIITVNGQKLKVVDIFFYLGITLSRALHILTELQKPVWLSEDSVQMSGSEMESSLTPSLKSARLLYCLPSCIYVIPGQFTNVIQRDLLPLPLKLFEKAVKIKWRDKIPDTVVLKKAGVQSMHTLLKLAKLRWTGHVIINKNNR